MFGFSSESEKLLNEIYVSRISSLIRQTSSMSKRLAHNTQNFTVTTNKIHKKSSELSDISSSSGSSSSNNNKNNNKDNKSDRLLNSGESQKSSQNFGSKSNKSTGRNSINKNTNNAGALSGLRTEMHTNTNISKTNRKVGEKNKNTNTQNNSNNNNNNNNNSSQSNNNNNNNNNNGNSSLTSRSDLDRIYDNMNGIKQRLMERPGNNTNGSSGVAQYCPEVPPDLQGKMLVNFNLTGEIKVNNIKLMNPALRSGGSWKPAHCISRHRVAIIIPYRDRHQHLLTLLYHLLPMLRRQQLDFRIFVVEQLFR
ncbi:Hypothetical predicted protein [Octopus vulgaris]|uniref:Beta-1,4-galactosyltransferase n=1 Tax=Octopus vulgaris TaxID=6645 RepID=A0AA36F1P3_OCTVU|nr:Hypothetical predicted protein [Octopus vulgaris]